MRTLLALTLAAGLTATVAPVPEVHAAETPITITAETEVVPLPVAELCGAGLLPSSSGPCTQLGRRLAVSAAICAASTFGFLKAIRMARAAAVAIRAGEGFVGAFFGGAAVLFCWDVYDKYWEWSACRGGQQYAASADIDVSAIEEELADFLDEAADELEAGRLPDYRESIDGDIVRN